MASDVRVGIDGTVAGGGLMFNVHNFVLTVTGREFEATTFGDGDWEDFIVGTRSARLVANCYASKAKEQPMPGSQATATVSDGNMSWSGTYLITEVSHDVTKTGQALVTVSGPFKGTVTATPTPSDSPS